MTNIDTEIKEAEDFLSEDQITLIRSIADVEEPLKNIPEHLRPTLRSLGLAKQNNSSVMLNSDDDVGTGDESDEFDSDDFDDDDGNLI